MDPQVFRSRELKNLPAVSGIYALCDLDEVPIYIGESKRGKAEGIGPRVRRHLTSARSDVVANRQLDVWEIAFVWAWPSNKDSQLQPLESFLFHKFDRKSKLINGSVPRQIKKLGFPEPQKTVVQVMTDDEIAIRKNPSLRFPRQVAQFNQLLDWVLNTKDANHLRRALEVHFERVCRFYNQFADTEAKSKDKPSE